MTTLDPKLTNHARSHQCPVREATRFALADSSLEHLTALSCEEVLAIAYVLPLW